MRVATDIVFDLDTKRVVDASNVNAASTTTQTLYVENLYLLRCNIYENASENTKLNLTAATSFKLGIGLLDSTPMVQSLNSQFVAADWASWDVATGMICARINTDSSALETWLGTKEWASCYVEVKATDPVSESTICMFPVTIRNTVYDV